MFAIEKVINKSEEKARQPSFDDINISTTTVIVATNIEINLEWLYSAMCITMVDITGLNIKANKDFQKHVIKIDPRYGGITMAQYKNNLKGFKIMKKKKKFFRNALSIVMYVGKLITIKIPRKGQLQMTGCITPEHSQLCVQYLWEILRQQPNTENFTYKLSKSMLTTMLRTVMTDIVFNLGFNINRQKLDLYMNKCTEFNSLLETSFGYTGVNIKIPFQLDIHDNGIRTMCCSKEGTWENGFISYETYMNGLSPKDYEKESKKNRRNTFLVFHSGTVIMSGMTVKYMRDVYDKFVCIMNNARREIEEIIISISCRFCNETMDSTDRSSDDLCRSCCMKGYDCDYCKQRTMLFSWMYSPTCCIECNEDKSCRLCSNSFILHQGHNTCIDCSHKSWTCIDCSMRKDSNMMKSSMYCIECNDDDDEVNESEEELSE